MPICFIKWARTIEGGGDCGKCGVPRARQGCAASLGLEKRRRILHCPRVRRLLLQIYRFAMLAAILWLLREHAVRVRVESLRPLTVAEVRPLFPAADRLEIDESDRGGWRVIGPKGAQLGYVLQTAPVSDAIIGYRGWTDTLVAFDPALHVVGVRIRASQDTAEHVGDIRDDRSFLKTWNGRSWDEVAGRTPEEEGIEGVSGASMTSLAMAEGIVRRLRAADNAAKSRRCRFAGMRGMWGWRWSSSRGRCLPSPGHTAAVAAACDFRSW